MEGRHWDRADRSAFPADPGTGSDFSRGLKRDSKLANRQFDPYHRPCAQESAESRFQVVCLRYTPTTPLDSFQVIAVQKKKIFAWKTGFWGSDSLGWNYDLIFVSMLLVIVATAGGSIRLT